MLTSGETRLTLSEHIHISEVGEEWVILDTRNGQYFGLNSCGAQFCRLTKELGNPHAVVKRMKETFEIGEEQLWHDFQVLVEGLLAAGLIEIEHTNVGSAR